MKKVVNEIETNQTLLSDINIKKYYGVVDNQGDKGFVTREDYQAGNYLVYVTKYITEGNGFGQTANTLSKLLKSFVNIDQFEVYEFDTPKELFKWLSE